MNGQVEESTAADGNTILTTQTTLADTIQTQASHVGKADDSTVIVVFGILLLFAFVVTVTIFMKYMNPTKQINSILNIMQEFKPLSGLSINVSKTKYALLGNAKDCPSITQNTLVKKRTNLLDY